MDSAVHFIALELSQPMTELVAYITGFTLVVIFLIEAYSFIRDILEN